MYQTRRRMPSLPWILGALAALVALVIWLSPRIVQFTPPSGSSQVPAITPITLTFSRPMDTLSVESRLLIEPMMEGRLVWEGRTLIFQPAVPWQAGETISVRLEAGARSTTFLPLLTSYTWSFSIGSPRIVYLWPEDGPANIYARSLDGEEPVQLTELPLGVLDYSIGPRRLYLVYTAVREDGGSDLHLLDLASNTDRLLYACPSSVFCRKPVISYQGDLVAFEQATYEETIIGKNILGPSRVWAIRITEGVEAYPIGPANHATSNPSWSPHGRLAYYDSTLKAIALVNPALGKEPQPLRMIPNEMDVTVEWSPDGSFFVFPEVHFLEGQYELVGGKEIPLFYSHVYRVEEKTGIKSDLTGEDDGRVEDTAPIYSPDGKWICFVRKNLERERWTLGHQVWLMRSNASERFQIVNEPDFNQSSIAWSPDSQVIVYNRFNQSDLAQPVEIWLVNIEEKIPQEVIAGGYSPQWIP